MLEPHGFQHRHGPGSILDGTTTDVYELGPEHRDEINEVLCDAFADYPVMRYVLGDAPRHGKRLERLVNLFVAGRIFYEDLMLGVRDESGRLAGAALLSLPGDRTPEPRLEALRELTWTELGSTARRRYTTFANACADFAVNEHHHHLNMIGVSPECAGRGYARTLLTAVHELVDADPESAGITLTTESVGNVSLYRYFGYTCLGQRQISPQLETWGFYRQSSTQH